MKKEKKSRKKVFIIYYIIIAIVIVISSIYSYSSYISTTTAEPQIDVAAWQIDIKDGENNTYTQNIELNNTITSTVYNATCDTSIVPGTSGKIAIVLNYSGTEVSTRYNITVASSSLPDNLQLYSNEACTLGFTGATDIITLGGSTTSKTIYIYWKWNYVANTDESDWMGKDISVNLNVDVWQYNGE